MDIDPYNMYISRIRPKVEILILAHNSYVKWSFDRQIRYGRVQVYLHLYDWHVALIHQISISHQSLGTIQIRGGLGALICIDISQILGPTGRLKRGAITYLVDKRQNGFG